MDGWDIALLAVAGYIAVVALVRLMLRRRNQLIEELLKQAEEAELAQQELVAQQEAAHQPRLGTTVKKK
jgi:hypothetical protein